jgi:hypothetical protein
MPTATAGQLAVTIGVSPFTCSDFERIIMEKDKVENSEELADINRKILAEGEAVPSIRLKDGTKVQTGTVATMLHNIQLYNQGERGTVEKELELALPTLFKIGLFDLFSPDEWIIGGNPGRAFVGRKAKEFLIEQSK